MGHETSYNDWDINTTQNSKQRTSCRTSCAGMSCFSNAVSMRPETACSRASAKLWCVGCEATSDTEDGGGHCSLASWLLPLADGISTATDTSSTPSRSAMFVQGWVALRSFVRSIWLVASKTTPRPQGGECVCVLGTGNSPISRESIDHQ